MALSPRIRQTRHLRRYAEVRAQVRRMNELAPVVRAELERADGGTHYGDTSGGYERSMAWDRPYDEGRPAIGFRA